MGRVSGQPPLPLVPGEAVAIGDVAGLVEGPDGGVVYVFGAAAYTWEPGDEAARRFAAVQLVKTKTASQVATAAGFAVSEVTLWRWCQAYDTNGLAGLLTGKSGPKSAWRLTEEIAEKVRVMDAEHATLAAIAAATGVSYLLTEPGMGYRFQPELGGDAA